MYCINLHLRRNGKDITQLLDEEEDQHNQSHLIPDMVPQFLGRISLEFNINLINILLEKYQWNFQLEDIVNGLYHEYETAGGPEPVCDRWSGHSRNLVRNSSLWTLTIPHPKYSGRCFTYKFVFGVNK